MKIHNFGLVVFGFGGFFGFTLFSAFILSSSNIYANEPAASASANAAVIVPDACTLSGTGTSSHSAEIANGTSNSNIGETTMKAYCNDNEGFAIYAIGYTDNTDGKNVLTNSTLGSTHDIATGIDTSGNSKWAMKVTTVSSPTPTYPITIQNSFDSFHTVPDDYALVAKRTAGTDIGQNAEGSTLKTTYQAYISSTQLAATYTGQVKYVLVHPSTAPQPVSEDQIGLIYDGNGMNFASGASTNRLIYNYATISNGFIATTPTISKTPNVNNDGSTTSGYAYSYTRTDPVVLSGAERLKVEIDFGIEENYDYLYVFEGIYDGEVTSLEGSPMEAGQIATFTGGNGENGTETQFIAGSSTSLYVDGDTVTFAFFGDDFEDTGYYGYYARVYPIYDTEHDGTEEIVTPGIDNVPVSGTYASIPGEEDSWYTTMNGVSYSFQSESDILGFVNDKADVLKGNTLVLYRSVSMNEAFSRAGKTMVGGYYVMQDMDNTVCSMVGVNKGGTVIDIRDNNTYLVKKLKDGNCWMLDNLMLDPTNSATASNMSASNTNAPADAVMNYLNGGSENEAWSDVAVSGETDPRGSYLEGYTNPFVITEYKDGTATNYGMGSGKVGVYYNYCAATMGTYCYGYGDDPAIEGPIISASYDVCPINWRMPTGGGETGEYKALFDIYNTTTIASSEQSLQYNLSTPLSGASYGHDQYLLNEAGYWWSSTVSVYEDEAFFLKVEPSDVIVDPSLDPFVFAGPRYQAHSIRCIVAH